MGLISALILLGIAVNVTLNLRLEKKMAIDKATFDAKLDELTTRLTAVLSDLLAKIAAGSQPVDFQPEADKLQAAINALNAADPTTTPAA